MPGDLPSLEDLLDNEEKDSAEEPSADLTTQQKFEKKMGQIAHKEAEVDAQRRASVKSHPHIDLEKFPISQEALKQIPLEKAQEVKAICFYVTQEEMRIGALDPDSAEVKTLLSDLQKGTRAHIVTYLISQNSLDRVFNLYGTLPKIKAIEKNVQVSADDLEKVKANVTDLGSLQGLFDSGTTTDLVTILMGAAFKVDASDAHVEAEENQIVVRYRIDGILHDVATLPKESFKKLISRIKLLSSLKINITTKPQDGRFTIKLPDGDVDVRVSTMPTVYGESVVMRLLRQNQEGVDIDKLGFLDGPLSILKREISRPNGMIITTGPTGSGKTTTLYAILKALNKPGVKIITLEDPVEYRLEGINQSAIDHSKGYTFAKGLRSILRQDPDIVMVGEIRDLETAEIAVQAALTGHLVLSTIHTNSAAGAIPRFLSMGVKPFLLAPALNCIIGQRLARRLVPDCSAETTLDAITEGVPKEEVQAHIERLPEQYKEAIVQSGMKFHTAAAECPANNGLSYKGRTGLYEIFAVDKEMEQLIQGGQSSEYEIEAFAQKRGMISMIQDGIIKANKGITSLDEIYRVIE